MSALVEVIVCSLEDAIEAWQGGAGRLEIVRDPGRGGLTPPIELVEAIVAAVAIPVRVMLRDKEDHEVEPGRLPEAARALSALPLDGLVTGMLRGGEVHLDGLRAVLAGAPTRPATFHRAIEQASDPIQAIAALKSVPQVDRVLMSGGTGSLHARAGRLRQLAAAASPEIVLIAGGGVTLDLIRLLRESGGPGEFHAGRAARDSRGHVKAARVRECVQAARLTSSC